MNRELHRMFDSLSGRTTAFVPATGTGAGAAAAAGGGGGAAATAARADGLVPVNPSRFQVSSSHETFDAL